MKVFGKKGKTDSANQQLQDNSAAVPTAVTKSVQKNKRIPLIAVVLVLLGIALVGGLVFRNYNADDKAQGPSKYDIAITEAKKLLDERNYKESYDTLISVENEVDTESGNSKVEYYVLISRSAYMSGSKEEAKTYAQKGVDNFDDNTSYPGAGITLNDILSDIYYEQPIEKDVVPVPKSQSDKPGFQG